jgi:hypothetical protein
VWQFRACSSRLRRLLGFDLLTGVFVLTPSALIDKRRGVTLEDGLRNWGLVFIGNFAGAFTVARRLRLHRRSLVGEALRGARAGRHQLVAAFAHAAEPAQRPCVHLERAGHQVDHGACVPCRRHRLRTADMPGSRSRCHVFSALTGLGNDKSVFSALSNVGDGNASAHLCQAQHDRMVDGVMHAECANAAWANRVAGSRWQWRAIAGDGANCHAKVMEVQAQCFLLPAVVSIAQSHLRRG